MKKLFSLLLVVLLSSLFLFSCSEDSGVGEQNEEQTVDYGNATVYAEGTPVTLVSLNSRESDALGEVKFKLFEIGVAVSSGNAFSYEAENEIVIGGEPLLYPEVVYAIMKAATELSIPKRQVITNGAFTADPEKMREVAMGLRDCGVNDLLVSVDAFHQRALPIERVKLFLREVIALGVTARLQPAWLVSREDENPYNKKTREILLDVSELEISENDGNIVFPEGNAKVYLKEYFKSSAPKNPYEDDPYDVRCISVSPNGDVLCGNLYKQELSEILDGYDPKIFLRALQK